MKDNKQLLEDFYSKYKKKFVCKRPFELVEMDDEGYIYLCFPRCNRGSYSVGNLFDNTFEEIMRGEKVQKFKKDILNSEYKYCDFNNCAAPSAELNIKNPDFDSLINIKYPEEVRLHIDRTCNIKCIMCRNDLITKDSREDKLRNIIIPRIVEMCREAKIVFMNGVGEVLFSPFAKELILTLTEKYPDIKFDFCTNGILCTKERLKEYNLENRIKNISISLHCIKEKTYEKILINGNYKKVMENLQYLKTLRDNKVIDSICLNFVVNEYNYKEMIAFAKFAKENKFIANFSALININWSQEEYKKFAVHLKNSPKYNKLRKILRNPIFDSPFCLFDNAINEVKKDNSLSKETLWKKLLLFYK